MPSIDPDPYADITPVPFSLGPLNLFRFNADPDTASSNSGDMFYNTTTGTIRQFNGTSWQNIAPYTGTESRSNTFTSIQTISPSTAVTALVLNAAASSLGLVIKLGSSGTSDLQQWQNNAGTVLAKMSSTGKLTAIIDGGSA
jgi:hypothetical protein